MWGQFGIVMSPVIFIFIIILSVLLYQAHRFKTFANGRSFEDYKREHSANVAGGRVSCFHCGSNSIYLRNAGGGFGRVLNSHVCRQCGTELYRSFTPR